MPFDARIAIEFTITNIGPVAGTEIAQLYVRDQQTAVARPEKELKGFSRVTLAPGESRVVEIGLTAQDFAYWDTITHAWKTEPHAYTLLVGGASNRIALQGTVTLR